LLPVHWGTFNLAMHAWDFPAEVLYAARAQSAGSLLMPQLGEPIEPAQDHDPKPWWRALQAKPEPSVPSRSGSLIQRPTPAMPWPLD
jgi:hypothetical protein